MNTNTLDVPAAPVPATHDPRSRRALFHAGNGNHNAHLPADLPVLPAPHVRLLTVTSADALGALWPATTILVTEDGYEDVLDVYSGNAHSEGRDVPGTCSYSDAPCTACEVEEGRAIMVDLRMDPADVIARSLDTRFPSALANKLGRFEVQI